jgi:hypothetical protein
VHLPNRLLKYFIGTTTILLAMNGYFIGISNKLPSALAIKSGIKNLEKRDVALNKIFRQNKDAFVQRKLLRLS